jgi:hypothetical protein
MRLWQPKQPMQRGFFSFQGSPKFEQGALEHPEPTSVFRKLRVLNQMDAAVTMTNVKNTSSSLL